MIVSDSLSRLLRVLALGWVSALVWLPACGRTEVNLALGKEVVFSPEPNYALTLAGDTDAFDLTDGSVTRRVDKKMWYNDRAVGYSMGGIVQLSLDLGKVHAVDAVSLRMQSGSPQSQIGFPVRVELFVSDDGKTFYRTSTFDKRNREHREQFGIPETGPSASIHTLRFSALKTRARYVGFTIDASGLLIMDELEVWAGAHPIGTVELPASASPSFSINEPRIYFRKPEVSFSPDVLLPIPIGYRAGRGFSQSGGTLELELPEDLLLRGGWADNGGIPLRPEESANGHIRYKVPVDFGRDQSAWGAIYLGGDWKPGRVGNFRHRVRWKGGSSPWIKQAVKSISVPSAPQPKQLITGLSWWHFKNAEHWPHVIESQRYLGFNTFPVIDRYAKKFLPRIGSTLNKARDSGFQIMNVDSPIHEMLAQAKHKKRNEVFCQLEDGGVGARFCPSYRGPLYKQEVRRLAEKARETDARYINYDIELYEYRGPTDHRRCTRCRESFRSSGQESWDRWLRSQGSEIWQDFFNAISAHRKGSANASPFELGLYASRPGRAYQGFWPVDSLYPKSMHNTQVSTYSDLQPYHLALIGDRVLEDRKRLGASDVIPWITPGDAGSIPRRAFRNAILECFGNGARGVLFWSGRYWDADMLAGYADAIRTVAPVEKVIVRGDPVSTVHAEPGIRVRGMRFRDEIFLLVSDYAQTERKEAMVTVTVNRTSKVVDLADSKLVGQLDQGTQTFKVELTGGEARALWLAPEGAVASPSVN